MFQDKVGTQTLGATVQCSKITSFQCSPQHVSLTMGRFQQHNSQELLIKLHPYCLQVAFRQEVRVVTNTWYSFSISTTISALCLNLLHHPWCYLIDPDIHPTAITGIASYHWVLQTVNNQLQIPYISSDMYHEGKQSTLSVKLPKSWLYHLRFNKQNLQNRMFSTVSVSNV